MQTGRIDPKHAAKHLAAMAGTVRQLWKQACQHDGIDPSASFVVFSDGNPYRGFYNSAVEELMRDSADYQAGGYVGMTIVGGKAR